MKLTLFDSLPKRVWSRVFLVFLALCVVKFLVLFSLRKELYQIHWRTIDQPYDWLNYALFGVFTILVGLAVYSFGVKCAAKGLSGLRAGFVLVAVIMFLFVCVTFHEGNRNYLSPVLRGTLQWSDLKSYFALNFIFRAPYLGGWLIGVAAIYYGLIRSGRERLMIPTAGVAAAAYLLVNMRELAYYRSELAVLNAVGTIFLVAGFRSEGKLHWLVSWLPLCMASVFFPFFAAFDPSIARPNSEFIILALCSAVVFGGLTLIAWRRGIGGAWSWLLPFASATFVVLCIANFHLADNYRYLLMSGLALPRYFISEGVFCGALLLMAGMVHKWRASLSVLWLDVVGLAAIVLAVIDLRLVQIMGVRLDWQVLAFGDSPKMIWKLAKPYLPMVSLVLVVAGFAYWLSLRILAKLLPDHSTSERVAPRMTFAMPLAFMVLGVSGLLTIQADKAAGMVVSSLVATSPWWKQVSQPSYSEEKFISTAKTLGLDYMLSVSNNDTQKTPRDLNVVLILQESVYNQHQSLFGGTNETQPLLSQYRDRMELFPNFYCNFLGSIHARFAVFTGLYPVSDFKSFTKETVPVKSLFEALSAHGYETSVFYSSYFDYTNFRDLLRNHGVRIMYDADTMPGSRSSEPVSWGIKEEETLAAIQTQIQEYSTNGKKFFLTYVPAAPHYPYDGTPSRFLKFKLGSPFDYTPRYLNELLYMDWVIASILDELKETGLLDRTLVVITSDHGELLGGERGDPIGHGWKVTPELANVPLIIMDPSRPSAEINAAVGSQVDLLPTIMDILGLPLPEDQLYQGVSLRDPGAMSKRPTYVNSFQEFAFIRSNTISCGSRTSGNLCDTFEIESHSGAPSYIPSTNGSISAKIGEFDSFQESFLRHYSKYVRMFRTPGSVE